MRHYLLNSFVFAVLLSMAGCRMSMDEYSLWEGHMQRDNADLRQKIADKEARIGELKADKARKEQEKEYLIGKSVVIAGENAKLIETWDGMSEESHSVMMNLFTRIHDSEKAFYDVRLGNPPMAMKNTCVSEKYTVLVDMEHTVLTDCHIQAAELYTSHAAPATGIKPTVCFVILAKNEAGYSIRSASDFLGINAVGLNTFSFANAPLDAQAGDRFGMILSPGASVDYEEVDTGKICMRNLKAIPDSLSTLKLQLEMPAQRGKAGPGSMETAFMLRGTSDLKSLFLVDEPHKFTLEKTLAKATVEIKVSDETQVPVYLALIGKAPVDGYYLLRDISPMTMVSSGSPKEILLEHKTCPDGHKSFCAKPGDVFALVLPGITSTTKVKADFGVLKTVAPFDYAKPFFMKQITKMERETGNVFDSNVIFVSFRVE